MSNDTNLIVDLFAEVLAESRGMSKKEALALLSKRASEARARIKRDLRRGERFAAHLRAMTDEQAVMLDAKARNGYLAEKVYVSRKGPRVAVLLCKRAVWNEAKGKLDTKLLMIYPDGSVSETFERSIEIRRDF